jgi:hypothetical protein
MSSRDFSFLSLRPPIAAYQSNGLPVAGNNVFITSSNGAVTFSNSMNLSSITVNTLQSNTISTNTIIMNIVNASSINANNISTNLVNTDLINVSSIYTGYLESNSSLISTLNVNIIYFNNEASITTSTNYNGMILETSGDAPIILASTNNSPQYAIFSKNGNILNMYTTINSTLKVNYDILCQSSIIIQSSIILNGDSPDGYGSLKIERGPNENSIFIKDGTNVNPSNINNGYFIGNSNNFGGPSTFQIGRIDNGLDITTKAIYLTQSGKVGIGVINPQTNLDINGNVMIYSTLSTNYGIVNQKSGIRLIDGFGNTATRPSLAPTSTLSSFIIQGASGTANTADDGFLQLSSGGGTDINTISYIQISGYANTVPDMHQNIVFGTSGAERMRIIDNGNIGIGTNSPQYLLDINGNQNISGYLISRVATAEINNNSPTWSTLFGKYCFVTNSLANLTIGGSPLDGTQIIFINTTGGNITVNGNIIASNNSLTFVYTTVVGPGWYSL